MDQLLLPWVYQWQPSLNWPCWATNYKQLKNHLQNSPRCSKLSGMNSWKLNASCGSRNDEDVERSGGKSPFALHHGGGWPVSHVLATFLQYSITACWISLDMVAKILNTAESWSNFGWLVWCHHLFEWDISVLNENYVECLVCISAK
jgi:hypothetical protein